jgi:hypothetical protein
MIQHIRGNWLLITLIIVYVAYGIVGWLTPRPYMSSIVGIMALMSGVFMFSRYAGAAWRVLWGRERGEVGAHQAVLGVVEFAAGIIYSAMFRLVWNYFGQPDSWTSTWFSSLGLFMIAKGAYRVALSPTDDIPTHRFPEGFWTVVLWMFGLMIAYVAGATFGR